MIAFKPLAFAILLAGPFVVPAPQSDYTGGCEGCIGGGGSGTSSGGSCGGMLTVQVVVTSGKCKWFASQEPLLFECAPSKGCKPSVTRTWSDLPANSAMEFCVTVAGEEFCLSPTPSTGPSGSGSDTRSTLSMSCGEGGAGMRFSASSSACGLSASAVATCSQCLGDV